MNWQTFKEILLRNPDLHLQFQFDEDQWVNSSYHITEIKQAQITSVDCGGKMNAWTEVIIQLWEPVEKEDSAVAMEVKKALKIIDLVEGSLPLHPLATVKIEFGNSTFDTRQMHPEEIIVVNDNLNINLQADITQCKANNRGQTCGKPKSQLAQLGSAVQDTCTPGGSCCN